jgi:hypothetical protein
LGIPGIPASVGTAMPANLKSVGSLLLATLVAVTKLLARPSDGIPLCFSKVGIVLWMLRIEVQT